MRKIAVIDTETTWFQDVMSIGVVVADSNDYSVLDRRYYILDPEYKVGGMFSYVLQVEDIENQLSSRSKAIEEMKKWLSKVGVKDLYAYNAKFDKGALPELSGYVWHDIMRLAAYRQYNSSIPGTVECCKTGRIKSGFGVEPIMRMLAGDNRYCEIHNAIKDAEDELAIMRMLGHPIEKYEIARI